MNLLRRKLASFLIDAARQAIERVDPSSPCARALAKLDLEPALSEDIGRLTAALSVSQIVRLLSLGRRLREGAPAKQEAAKEELKDITRRVVDRVENESGPLKLPPECRDLLWGL